MANATREGFVVIQLVKSGSVGPMYYMNTSESSVTSIRDEDLQTLPRYQFVGKTIYLRGSGLVDINIEIVEDGGDFKMFHDGVEAAIEYSTPMKLVAVSFDEGEAVIEYVKRLESK